MGIYDRDYMHNNRQGRPMRTMPRRKRSVVATIIMLNMLIWLVNAFVFLPPDAKQEDNFKDLNHYMALRATDIYEPAKYYHFITSGFAHSPDPSHILGNMIMLFFFGPHLEQLFGRRTFLLFYLLAIICGGIFWCVSLNTFPPLMSNGTPIPPEFLKQYYAFGASGAVTAVVILFAFCFPHVMVRMFFLIPIPMWLLGLLYVGYDLYYAQVGGTGIGHSAHLGGAALAMAFALLYKPVTRIFTGTFFRRNILPRGDMPRLYQPEPEFQHDPNRMYVEEPRPQPVPQRNPQEIQDEENYHRIKDDVDRILLKIAATGINSLTPEEQQTMLEASEIYKRYKSR